VRRSGQTTGQCSFVRSRCFLKQLDALSTLVALLLFVQNSVLLFCSSKKGCENAAAMVAQLWKDVNAAMGFTEVMSYDLLLTVRMLIGYAVIMQWLHAR